MEHKSLCSSTSLHEAYSVCYDQKLGRGSFGTVYVAREKSSSLEYAIKITDKSELRKKDPNLEQRIWNEVRIYKELNHPNIIKMKECFQDNRYIYMIIELCKTGDLRHYIERKKANRLLCLTENESATFLYQLINALMYLHNRKIIHRDLSASNILLTEDYSTLKICDFGLSTKLNHASEKHNTYVGTPNYISPEIASGRTHSFETDVFSLGCVFYSMLKGESRSLYTEKDDRTLKVPVKTSIESALESLKRLISQQAHDLLSKLLCVDAKSRIKLYDALRHPFIRLNHQDREKPVVRSRQYSQNSGHDSGFCTASLDRVSCRAGSCQSSRNYESEQRHRIATSRPLRAQRDDNFTRPPLPTGRNGMSDHHSNSNMAAAIDAQSLHEQHRPFPSLCHGASPSCCVHSRYDDDDLCLQCQRPRSISRSRPMRESAAVCSRCHSTERAQPCEHRRPLTFNVEQQQPSTRPFATTSLDPQHERRSRPSTASSRQRNSPMSLQCPAGATASSGMMMTMSQNGRRTLRDFVSPLVTRGLEPQEGKCDRYAVRIGKDGIVRLEHYERNLQMAISADGLTVYVAKLKMAEKDENDSTQKTKFTFDTLPKDYWKSYKLAFDYVSLALSKAPCLAFHDPIGLFYLRNNGAFDGKLYNGKTIRKSKEELANPSIADVISDDFSAEERTAIQKILNICLYSIKLNLEAKNDASLAFNNMKPDEVEIDKENIPENERPYVSLTKREPFSDIGNSVKQIDANIFRIMSHNCRVKLSENSGKITVKYDNGDMLVQSSSILEYYNKASGSRNKYESPESMPADVQQKVQDIRLILLMIDKFKRLKS